MVAQLDDSPVTLITRMPIGEANEAYDVVLRNQRRIVLRVLRTQNAEGALREHRVQLAVQAAGLLTPVSLELRSGQIVGDVDGNFFTISDYISGSSSFVVTDKLVTSLGATLAKFHLAVENVDLEGHREWLNRAVLDEQLPRLQSDDRNMVDRLLEGTEVLFTSNLPQVNIHGDMRLINVFVADEQITTLFDFETAERNIRLLDIACTAMGLAERSDLEFLDLGNAVADGYEKHLELSATERRLLPVALRYTATACGVWALLADFRESASRRFRLARALTAAQ